MRSRGGVNTASIYTNEAIGGRELIAELPRVLSVDMVKDAIDFAYEHDWNPNEAGEPLHCKHTRRGFVLPD